MVLDMTKGSPIGKIMRFFLPVMLGNLLQQFYSLADSFIVSRFLGVEAFAGVSATGSLHFLIIGFTWGVCSGFAIPISQEFGADTDLLRLPYGNGTDPINAALGQAGFRLAGWSVDSRDWNGDPAEKIAGNVMDQIKAGDVILFQNNMEATPAALDLILEELGGRAYEAVSLEEIWARDAEEKSIE